MKAGAWLRVIAINLLVLVALGGVLEIAARLAFPEFRGHIHSPDTTQGVHFTQKKFHDFWVRVPAPEYEIDTKRPLFVVLGDSISNGYGMAYEDIYWVRAARMLGLRSSAPVTALALAGYGNNLGDSARAIQQLAKTGDVKIASVLYQFNFNDITPFDREALHGAPAEGAVGSSWFKQLALWRYEYLNRSVFFRMVQHYAGALARRTTGTCEERGLDAMGAYTWSFGSRPFKADAERYWTEFESRLAEVKRSTDGVGARLAIFVSPLIFDVDKKGLHPYFNHVNLDFSCATIDPRARLNAAAAKLGIPVIDPAEYVRRGFEARIAEGNLTPFYFPGDENHFNATAAGYIGQYLAARLPGNAPPAR
jgi:hypothetical protein